MTNHETEKVRLHLANTEEFYHLSESIACSGSTYEAEEALKSYVENLTYDVFDAAEGNRQTSLQHVNDAKLLVQDLVGLALSEVDWRQLVLDAREENQP